MASVLLSVALLGGLGLVLGLGLGLAARKLTVPVDPRVERLTAELPGANCAACGFTGCALYARAMTAEQEKTNRCPVGGQAVADRLAGILGVTTEAVTPTAAFVRCRGDLSPKRRKAEYEGIATCAAAALVAGGPYPCSWGCLGFGDCARSCPYGAFETPAGRPPFVNEKKCTSCGRCVAACPRRLIMLRPLEKRVAVACRSQDPGKLVRKVCEVGCIACGLCVRKCPEHAIRLENHLAIIDSGACRNAGECIRVCPTKCLVAR